MPWAERAKHNILRDSTEVAHPRPPSAVFPRISKRGAEMDTNLALTWPGDRNDRQ